MNDKNLELAKLFSGAAGSARPQPSTSPPAASRVTFSSIYFSDIRKDIPNRDKYRFVRELVEFADQSKFAAVCFPERHFNEFGSIYANNSLVAAYFAPLTKHVRLRAAAVTAPLHHPAEVVENWAMVDILSQGRVDLGFGSGWNKADFILSPDTYDNRMMLRDERIEIIRRLWRGETIEFAGPGGEMFPITVHPRPLQPELNVWYSTFSERGFEHAGRMGYNIFTMLLPFNLDALGKKIELYRRARAQAGHEPAAGIVSLLMHTFVHPDMDYVHRVVSGPFKQYIASSVVPQLRAMDKSFEDSQIDKIVEYSYARYFRTGGIFGSAEVCQKQIDKAVAVGVNEIALLQDFGVDYGAVRTSLEHVEKLVDDNQ